MVTRYHVAIGFMLVAAVCLAHERVDLGTLFVCFAIYARTK